ncbi:multicopper oxidase family protein [Leeia sp. TBRC 13508]|uniref:Multicopper oxidase family protein n=1 Tax=Leeia speluncae TaxID=2884804 RepID=A0ABS8D4I2_9NEIS|nr:multicopper oxidase family protein [Leeia speluncae]MCB6183105.1 multicopper oxidase family protein [Leeia speluncae]
MKRRQFLSYLSGAAAISALPFNAMAEEPAHTMHMNAVPAKEVGPLAPVSALPTGKQLIPVHPLKNESTIAGVFKGTLTAAPIDVSLIDAGKTTFWSYNGQVPGPLIEVMAGDTVEILFKNHLTQATTVHWHGLPVPPDQDGNPDDLVLPGENRLYKFTLPKDSAGTYWYHPHPHGTTPEQVYRGLAGVFIVKDPTDPIRSIPERHLVVSDLKLLADGKIAPNDANDEMNGREGQFVLINGLHQPLIQMQAKTERWRIWNATSARYLNLSWGNASVTQVGTDGGLLEHPIVGLTGLLVSPAERVELLVSAENNVELAAEIYQRGKMGTVAPEKRLTLAQIEGVAEGAAVIIPQKLRSIPVPAPVKAKKKVVFSELMSMENGQHSMQFLINGKQFDMNNIDLISRLGEVEEWEIVNQADMDHPFHLHGVQFIVMSKTYKGQTQASPFVARRDIVNLRSGESAVIRVVQAFRGRRMFHCHILEHENLGMMGTLLVV